MSASTRNAAARQRRLPIITLSVAFAIGLLGLITPAAAAEMTFIHMGDVHGQLSREQEALKAQLALQHLRELAIERPRQQEMNDEKG